MSHVCKKILKFKLWLSSYWQNIKFSRYCPKFHIFTNIVIFQVFFCNFLDQLLHPYKFHGRDMSGILFFIFVSCHPLKKGTTYSLGPFSGKHGSIHEEYVMQHHRKEGGPYRSYIYVSHFITVTMGRGLMLAMFFCFYFDYVLKLSSGCQSSIDKTQVFWFVPRNNQSNNKKHDQPC